MSGTKTTPLTEDALGELGVFLSEAFPEPEHRYLFQPDVLRWKYLDPIGVGEGPRSLIVREGGRIVAHLGLHYALVDGVKAAYPYDWVAKGTKSPHGLMLLLRMHRLADVQYILGCTEVAAQVYERSGYQVATVAPMFQKVLAAGAWEQLHRGQPLWKKIVLLSLDRSRSWFRPGRVPQRRVELRRVERFGDEVTEMLRRGPPVVAGNRSAELLNHYLRFPPGTIRGWQVYDGGELCGLAMANVIPHAPVRLGKILECSLTSVDSSRWHAAYHAVVEELRVLGCQRVSAYGTAPWTADALRANGFFERGHTPLYWRDPKGRVALNRPFHLTYLEADTGLL